MGRPAKAQGAAQSHDKLVSYGADLIQQEWSPETIAGRLRQDYPDDPTMRMSPEGIYRWVYKDAAVGGSLYTHLPRLHKKRRKLRSYGSGRGLIPDRVSIDKRPAIVDERCRFGDSEGDTLAGAKGTGALATHVERKSRYLITVKLFDKQASTMADQTIKAFNAPPDISAKHSPLIMEKSLLTLNVSIQKQGLLFILLIPMLPGNEAPTKI
jgi:IS30 family transposase